MGSIDREDHAVAKQTTRLPLFNTTTHTASLRSYHKVTDPALAVPSTAETLLQGFARFVAAVSGGSDVTFLADQGGELFTALATLSPPDCITITKIATEPSVPLSDFGISISPSPTTHDNNYFLAQLQPLVVTCASDKDGRAAEPTLYLRSDYGPLIAAQHLLGLLVGYICPKANTTGADLQDLLPTRLSSENALQNDPDSRPTHLHQVLENSSRAFPHNIAVDGIISGHAPTFVRRELTYRELSDQVCAFANEIESLLHHLDWPDFRGDQKIVPVLLPASIELSIFMNAMSRIGHCFCALPMDAPQERLRDLLGDLGAPGILGVGPNPWEGSDFGKSIIWIDFYNLHDSRSSRSSSATLDGALSTRRVLDKDDLAYMIYTSGSSGKPKGVMVLHRIAMAFIHAFDSACNTASNALGSLPTGPRLRWMALCLPTFDVTLLDNFIPFFKGGTVCVADRNLLLTDPEGIISELRATATFTVSSLAMLLRPERVPTLTTVCVGGEMVGQRVVDNFAPRLHESGESPKPGSRHLINFYGPSETTAGVAIHFCEGASRPSIVGPPLPGTHFVVLEMTDSDCDSGQDVNAVPFGVAGELAIGGPQLSPGYLNRPAETAKAFIQHSKFGTLYRTGDKVRVVWTEQGQPMIDFLGRTSADQVKLNGRRVELAEIENVVASVEAVAQAVVLLVNKSAIVACVEPWSDTQDEEAVETQCRAAAERYLPAWMQPLHYFVVDKFPRTANDKVDRKTLERMYSGQQKKDTAIKSTKRLVQTIGDDSDKPLSTTIASNATQNSTSGSILTDPASIVYEGLSDALGAHIKRQSKTTVLANAGFDSLRALVFLQKLRDIGVNSLAIHTVLLASTIEDLIDLVASQQARTQSLSDGLPPVKECDPDAAGEAFLKEDKEEKVVHTKQIDTNGVDVSTIGKDDQKAIYGLSVEAKLRHFDYHCRQSCLEALHLTTHQLEQVLPATNVQVRFIGVATDKDLLDPERYTGRPHVEHFAYEVPFDMDPARFQRAVDAVLDLHDCFRTVFVATNHPLAPYAQCILSPSATKIPRVEIVCDDTDSSSSSSLWHQTIHSAQRAAEASMSLDKPGITLSYIWSPSRARCVMTMSLFHGIYDGTQLTYLRDEIAREYAAPSRTRLPTSELLPMRTAAELNLSYSWVETMKYWAGRFASVPGFRLRSRRPRPANELSPDALRFGAEETHMRLVSTNARMSLRQLSQAAVNMSTTMLTVVEAAWASVLAQTYLEEDRTGAVSASDSGSNKPLDVQFGTVMSGRRQREALMCMAPLMAAMPMRLLLDSKNGGEGRLTNREVCSMLVAQHIEAAPYLQIPCPTLTHARTGIKRIDTILLVQTLQPEGGVATSESESLRDFPGYNYEENLLAPYKEIDTGYPLVMELWPGKQSWDEKMLMRCLYNIRRPGYEFLTREWVAGVLGALDEAMARIVAEPDAPFYIG
ncbi:hypothetical protein BD289DRAFT_267257 [Coniella lustricola]|uniref:Carrier domain-containing protein n=1 Tax=Coniella lustricola TaxID=2025994 RepID=A0A2T3A788_9PEZI|nr:hypothetical protein BD289DRAFT_267257 [Coniella lustricola]